jgi:phosphonate transport system permease protein
VNARQKRVAALWEKRPRNTFLERSLLVMGALILVVFLTSGFELGLSAKRLANFDRFLVDVTPFPLQGKPFDFGVAWDWMVDLLQRGGFEAAISTLSISVVAIVLAMGLALLFTLPAARNFANPEPFVPGPKPPTASELYPWRALVLATRSILILLRAIPEYVWAFLLLSVVGLNAWTAILALALHNAGILGRLTSELVENVDTETPSALRGLGANRRQITVFSLVPQSFTRLLLYFFYRWETCVREATVLGMLGIASLGFLIDDARVAIRYDEMFFLILVGGAIVVAGDLVSVAARRIARRA